MRVIGTAGHVDHGKSTLVEALTGIHPDRLKEEREREMTIDLGFAWFELADGEEVGIVDVPGHRDFIENMLAGVGGIDAALFVIAADEGVMPQTREHLAILDLLKIAGGVVALTKIDLVEPDWLELVKDDIRQVLQGTVFAEAALVPVSARTRQGIDVLIEKIGACLAERPMRPDLGRPRLPIDRVFTLAGFGTIATGTLSDGKLKIGDELEILPQGIKGRVRSLQTHKRKEDIALPGSRTAVNVAGVQLEQVQRGNVLSHPGDYQPTRRLDARLHLLSDISQPIKHNTEVKLFIGATEGIARLRLLGTEELLPGEDGWIQLEVSEGVVAVRGDRFILRRPSPGETLGGGSVIDPHPKKRHKRFSEEVLINLETLSQGTPAEILLQSSNALGAATLRDLIARSNLNDELAGTAALELIASGRLITLEPRHVMLPDTGEDFAQPDTLELSDWIISSQLWDQITARIIQEVNKYHSLYPLKPGIPREELKSRLRNAGQTTPRVFNAALSNLFSAGELAEKGSLVKSTSFEIRYTPQQEQSIQRLLARFIASPYSPPSVKECQAEVGAEVFQALIENQELKLVSAEVVFRTKDYQAMVAEIRRLILQQGSITAAQVRDHFDTSRKYSLALLEHLDEAGITIRVGDARQLPGETKR